MATCNDCCYYPVCNYKMWCDLFKDKTNFVEVVRCKDCKFNHFVQPNDGIIHCGRESICGAGTVFRKAYDYCSYGERKDGE